MPRILLTITAFVTAIIVSRLKAFRAPTIRVANAASKAMRPALVTRMPASIHEAPRLVPAVNLPGARRVHETKIIGPRAKDLNSPFEQADAFRSRMLSESQLLKSGPEEALVDVAKSQQEMLSKVAVLAGLSGSYLMFRRMSDDVEDTVDEETGSGRVRCIADVLEEPLANSLIETVSGDGFSKVKLAFGIPMAQVKGVTTMIQDWWDGAPFERQHRYLYGAIHLYTSMGMWNMNAALRSGDYKRAKPFLPYLRMIFEACATVMPNSRVT
eukprot:TRINITY_DN14567_c0_g2_i1.p1 TRINITY_DN14567_c0_g2~~TRINITY_DN14567_c0_g2_i1.p1  ORF type:complete len:290 (+),score=28.47 TRINITY_DN14567_c0_g2_i1:61-870(+)